MLRTSIFLISCFFGFSVYTHTVSAQSALNLDFEIFDDNIPTGWDSFGDGDYVLFIDTLTAQSGTNSAVIEFSGEKSNFRAWSYTIPAKYQGEKIKLTGYIKTENITGYAGLWMRIDPSVDFDNMNDRGIKGTSDWTKYEIELDLQSSKAKSIVVGGLLVGKGKMWIDNLEITIDGKSLDQVPDKALLRAEKDKKFDKGSEIESDLFVDYDVEDLRNLGLIWGFLKYYHPNIAKGDFNWDYELFRILPMFMASRSKKAKDKILRDWIKGLGSFKTKKGKDDEELDIKIKPDLDWIRGAGFSSELISALTKVQNADRSAFNYYLRFNPYVGNPDFKTESPYSDMKYPDVGFRLLSLYRYWNVIQYTFPYKNLIEEDWQSVLTEFIPDFLQAENELGYKLSALELIGRIHDSHASIWGRDETLNKYKGVNGAPFKITFVQNRAVVTDYFNLKDIDPELRIGNVISKINGRDVSDIVRERLKYTPASNYPTQLRNIARDLLRTNDTILNMDVMTGQDLVSKPVKTYTMDEIYDFRRSQKKDTSFKMIRQDIAYINNGSLKRDDLPKIWEDLQDSKGLIIDIRNYPSDFLIYALSEYLMPDSIPFVKFSGCSVESPGLFTYGKSLSVGKKNQDYYKGKVIIIVNEDSQSSAEFHAMAYEVHPNATVIGSTTAGADGNVSVLYLPGNIKTMISGIGVYYPDGTETQRVGIVPDIKVIPTIESIRNGQDVVLEMAIELIEN